MEQENQAYLTQQIITYLGNKRSLLSFIGNALTQVQAELGKEKLVLFDGFSGSGIVARFFKQYASRLYVNDLEEYSRIINQCYLTNHSDVSLSDLALTLEHLQQDISDNLADGFITRLYAPKDDNHIQPGERVFYTRANARYIDTARQAIGRLPGEMQTLFLAPLLYGASVHNNTSGVFKGFYKNYQGVGQYGGEARNSLERILSPIELQCPVFSNFECQVSILQQDVMKAASELPEVMDLAYLDPPYNQHPYGSNYFMLNLIARYQEPEKISKVAGIPEDWNRSPYNVRIQAKQALMNLLQQLRSRYVLISYNSDGFIPYDEFIQELEALGDVRAMSTEYCTFRGSRNLRERDIYVKEYLFLLKKAF